MPPETVAASIIIMIWVLEWPTKCTVRTMSSTKLEASIKKAWDDCLAQNTRLVSEWGPHFHLPWHTAGLDSQASRSSFRTWGTVLVTFLQMQDVIRLKMWSRHCVMLQAWCSHGQVEPAVFQLWWSEFPVHEKQMQLMQMMPTFHGHGRARIVVSWYLPNSLMLNSSDQAATVPGKRKLHCTMQVRNLHLPECKFPARALPKKWNHLQPLRWKEDLASGRSWEKEGRWTDMFELWMEDWFRLLDLLFRADESIGTDFREGEVQSSPTNFNFKVYTIEVLLLKLLLHFHIWWTTSLPRSVVTCCDTKCIFVSSTRQFCMNLSPIA